MLTDKEQKSLDKYESAERRLILQFFESNKEHLEKYAVTDPRLRRGYDAYYISKKHPETTSFLEAKVRNFPMAKYDNWILEVKKLQTLVKYCIGNIYYINFFQEENGTYSAIFFNISKRIELWKTEGSIPSKIIWMNNQTFKNNGKIPKEVILLEFDQTMDTQYLSTDWR